MAASPFGNLPLTLDGPAVGAFLIAPSDAANLPNDIRAITIGTAGGVIVFDGWDAVTYTTGPLPVGTYPLLARRVRNTGTTATGLTGWM